MPPVVTDAERLRTALVNMLTNARHAVLAVRASGHGPLDGRDRRREPAVRVQTRASGGRVTIVIQDSRRSASRLRTWRTSSIRTSRRARAGTGLGLPIAKNIIEGLGGTLAVSSRRGEGTEIRIDLPQARAGRARMTPSHGSILLADDEEKILKRLGRALRDEGHEVVEATTIREAQRHLAERSFDLLVVDNLMPGMTGLELIRELSQRCRRPNGRRS